MSIADYRKRESQNELRKEALRPRPIFLIIASFFGFATLGVLLYREELNSIASSSFEYFFPLLLFILIGLGLFMVACYRMPALGGLLMGYGAVLEKDSVDGPKTMSYTKGFDAASGASEKRLATRRLSARQARRKYARQTAEMEKAKQQAADPTTAADAED